MKIHTSLFSRVICYTFLFNLKFYEMCLLLVYIKFRERSFSDLNMTRTEVLQIVSEKVKKTIFFPIQKECFYWIDYDN